MPPALPDDLISALDLARERGKLKQTIFKIVKRLGIEPQKVRSISSRGQLISYITKEEADLVVSQMLFDPPRWEVSAAAEAHFPDQGVFYLLLLEPEHDPGRFKVGFTASLSERVRPLRCSAPLLQVVKTWPCKPLWEKTAIESVAASCQRLHTEVFRSQSVEAVVEKCNRFFELMPRLPDASELLGTGEISAPTD